MNHFLYIPFLFTLGACIGSFLNVVVWRLPRGESLVHPPSRCPKCETKLSWRDNIPVIGWLMLSGKCRYCRVAISPKYPIFEAITGLLFVFYYLMFFIWQIGPCPLKAAGVGTEAGMLFLPRLLNIAQDWPIYALYMFLVASLLAASLIDAEHFIIPLEIPWLLAGAGIVVHAIVDTPTRPGALNVNPIAGAIAAGATVGLLISMLLLRLKTFPTSFPQGEIMEMDRPKIEAEIAQAKKEGREAMEMPPLYTPREIRIEMRKEMLFLFPPMLLGILWWCLTSYVAPLRSFWNDAMTHHWVSGLLGALLGAMVGGLVVWFFRIFGTLAFGRIAMGLGDVHLMFGVGAIIGAGAVTVAFFLAPFFGIILAVYMLSTGKKRELPYGPYLSLATAFVLVFYCDIAEYLAPGLGGLVFMIRNVFGLNPTIT